MDRQLPKQQSRGDIIGKTDCIHHTPLNPACVQKCPIVLSLQQRVESGVVGRLGDAVFCDLWPLGLFSFSDGSGDCPCWSIKAKIRVRKDISSKRRTKR